MKEQIKDAVKNNKELFFLDTLGETWLLLDIVDDEILAICREGIECFIPFNRVHAICP